MRITTQMMYNNFNSSLQLNMDAIYRDNLQISSGKKLNMPSDDPAAMYSIISGEYQLRAIAAYQDAITNATELINATSSAIGSIGSLIATAQATAKSSSSDSTDSDIRMLNNLMQGVTGIANSQIGDRYIFSGYKTDTAAVNATTGLYQGSSDRVSIEINSGIDAEVNIAGDEFIAYGLAAPSRSDSALMTPQSSDLGLITATGGFTAASDVYSALGGSISLSIGGGAATAITIPAGATLNDVRTAINAAATGVTAQVINANAGGATADYRIMLSVSPPSSAGDISAVVTTADTEGTGLNNIASSEMTSVYSTNGGSLDIQLGAGPVTTVTINAGATWADVRNAVNNADTGVRAEVIDANVTGTPPDYRLMLSATPSSTAADISVTVTTTDTAGYGLNRAASSAMTSVVSPDKTVIGAMSILKAAIDMDDSSAIKRASGYLDDLASTVREQEADLGVRLNRINLEKAFIETRDVDVTNAVAAKLTLTEAELARVILDGQQKQTALTALRSISSGFLQTSLFDFLK